MNKKYYLKGNSGRFFVMGQGFAASTQSEATAMTEGQVNCAHQTGFTGTKVAVDPSFCCNYIRKGDVNADGSIAANRKNPSKRRFATLEEAITHGSRFRARRLHAEDEPGTANHIGFYVTETNDPVNATVNRLTGLTNPL